MSDQLNPSDPGSVPPPPSTPGVCSEEYRRENLPLIPLPELRPKRPLPPDGELAAAMRLVPVAMLESAFATEAWLPSHPGQWSIEYPAWLAYAEEQRVARSAAEWAVYRLTETGLIEVVWPKSDRALAREWRGADFAAQAARYRGGRAPTVGSWDLFEDCRRLKLRSLPGLWDFYRGAQAGSADLDSCPSTTPPAQPLPAPTAGGSGSNRPSRDPSQPSQDRQDDILVTLRNEGTPLTRAELVVAMKLKTEGKLGAHLAWMVTNGLLVNVAHRGYWPAADPLPE